MIYGAGGGAKGVVVPRVAPSFTCPENTPNDLGLQPHRPVGSGLLFYCSRCKANLEFTAGFGWASEYLIEEIPHELHG